MCLTSMIPVEARRAEAVSRSGVPNSSRKSRGLVRLGFREMLRYEDVIDRTAEDQTLLRG